MKNPTPLHRASLRSISPFCAAGLLLGSSSAALAHAGDHSALSAMDMIHHWLTQSSHFGVFVASAVTIGLISLAVKNHRSAKRRSDRN